MDTPEQRMLMGNEAIGRGIVENGCTLAASYPGTPASEILSSVVQFAKETGVNMHIEWSINEKVAFETGLAHSYTGKRAAVAMKQVGLNVAADPFTRAAYLGVKGGFVVVVADDPGPHSSQTEQDSRFFAHFAKVPVFDPSSPREAKEMIGRAFDLSERYELPVMVRPTTRVCHARQNVACSTPQDLKRNAAFEKNPARWAATPQYLYELHRLLNEKISQIAGEESFAPLPFKARQPSKKRCVVASGVAFSHTYELLEDMGLLDGVDLFQVLMPYPLNRRFIDRIRSDYEDVLVIEETYPVIEMQFARPDVQGRGSGLIPGQGELTPDVIQTALERFFSVPAQGPASAVEPRGKRPSLCAGCSHRAAFYAIKETFPGGIYPSDIGCYTLGMNLGAVDTCHCMGACISQGAGFYHAYAQDGREPPSIVVTIGDSTFFHAGIPGLINSVVQKARFILVILDNSTTAMTGHQPTPQDRTLADGSAGNPVFIPDLVKACGVKFLKECDPYDLPAFVSYLKEAGAFVRDPAGGIAVIISKHPCLMDKKAGRQKARYAMSISPECTGCRTCIEELECPALVAAEGCQGGPGDTGWEGVRIDQSICTGCGVCQHVCPVRAIVAEE